MARVRLSARRFDECALRALRSPRISREQYTRFMRRCGFRVSHREHGLPRVCVTPFDDAPLVHDCLGMTEPGDTEGLYRAHLTHIVRWVVRSKLAGHSFEVSPAFLRRNASIGGFYYVLS